MEVCLLRPSKINLDFVFQSFCFWSSVACKILLLHVSSYADDDDRDNFGGGLSLVGEAGGKESDDEKRKKERKGKGGPGDEEPPPLYSIHHAKVYVILLA